MRAKIYGIGIIVLAAGLTAGMAPASHVRQVCLKDRCYHVEIATEEPQRSRGLQFRESLGKDAGMLFVFREEGIYPFWMKDTLIPLDIIWLDESRKVVDMAPDVPPCRATPCPVYTPRKQAAYVLELNAGQVRNLEIKPGDTAEFRQ